MNGRFRPGREWREFLLLVLVLAQLAYWYAGAGFRPLDNPDSVFLRSVWLGVSLQPSATDFTGEACAGQEALPPTARAWCQAWASSGWRPEWLKAERSSPVLPADRLWAEQEQEYERLQTAFRRITSRSTDRHPESVEPENPSPAFRLWLLENYGVDGSGALSLECVWKLLHGLKAAEPARAGEVLWWRSLMLEGKDTGGVLPAGAVWNGLRGAGGACAAWDNPEQARRVAGKAVTLLHDQRELYPRTLQMLALSHAAPVLFALWALTAWAVMLGLRRPWPALWRVGLHAIAWSAAWWLTCRVLGGDGVSPLPFFPVLGPLLWLAPLLLAWLAPGGRDDLRPAAQRPASVWILPGFVVLTGIGFFVQMDWSLNSYDKMRFIALRHANTVFMAFMVLSAMPLLGQPLYQLVARLMLPAVRWQQRAWQLATGPGLAMTALMLVPVLLLAVALRVLHSPQFTSELARLLVLLGLTLWFGSLSPARQQSAAPATLLLLMLTGLFILVVQTLSSDFGPVMIMMYTSVALLAGVLTAAMMARALRGPAPAYPAALVMGCLLGVLGLWLAFQVLYALSAHGNATVMERLVSQQWPFRSTNDQMALVSYFLDATPGPGYGLGHVPWLGDGRGVPEQAHSDYMPMMLYGVFGKGGLLLVYGGYLLWLGLIVLARARLTSGFHRDFSAGERYAAFLGWLSVVWALAVMVQLAMTLAGNLMVSPLTGISLPLVSHGWVSLLIQAALVGMMASGAGVVGGKAVK